MTGRHLSGRTQARILIRVFLARLFEHEATAGRTDLRESFFWLIGALAAPGLLFAFHQQFYWNFVALGPDGAARLRVYVLFDKTLYLALTFVAIGVVSVAIWNALIVDRRDALILGVLTVRRHAIVVAKLFAVSQAPRAGCLGGPYGRVRVQGRTACPGSPGLRCTSGPSI